MMESLSDPVHVVLVEERAHPCLMTRNESSLGLLQKPMCNHQCLAPDQASVENKFTNHLKINIYLILTLILRQQHSIMQTKE